MNKETCQFTEFPLYQDKRVGMDNQVIRINEYEDKNLEDEESDEESVELSQK